PGVRGAPFPVVPPEPKTLPFKLNGPNNQSKPSSLRLFWLISTNFDSIETCFGADEFAWSTNASTMSKLSCVLRTMSVPLCGQKVALALSLWPSWKVTVGKLTPMLSVFVLASVRPTSWRSLISVCLVVDVPVPPGVSLYADWPVPVYPANVPCVWLEETN